MSAQEERPAAGKPLVDDATATLLAPRRRRRRSSSSSSSNAERRDDRKIARRRRRRRSRLALMAGGASAAVVLAGGLLAWFLHRPPEVAPIPSASLETMLKAPPASDWRWWQLQGNPAVLVIEFPSLQEQGSTMNRIAAYLEKRGSPRDRLLDNRELAELIRKGGDNAATFYSGHDYSMDRVARFFTLADSSQLTLNGQETRLLENLLHRGVLKQDKLDGSYHSTSERALVSFTATQPDDPQTPQDEGVDAQRRESVLHHELSHGEFFTNSAYRQQCWDFWRKSLTEGERQMFRKYLAANDYDPENEELMVNETQAVLLHTPDSRAFRASDLGIGEAELEALRERLRKAK